MLQACLVRKSLVSVPIGGHKRFVANSLIEDIKEFVRKIVWSASKWIENSNMANSPKSFSFVLTHLGSWCNLLDTQVLFNCCKLKIHISTHSTATWKRSSRQVIGSHFLLGGVRIQWMGSHFLTYTAIRFAETVGELWKILMQVTGQARNTLYLNSFFT